MTRSPEAMVGESVAFLGVGECLSRARVSSSYYQANDPASAAVFRDTSSSHIFAAVLSSSAIHRVPALTYLRTGLAKAIQAQLELLDGAPGALLAALASLDAAWKRMHPFHHSVLENVTGLSLSYVDASRKLVYLLGYGSACAVAGSTAEPVADSLHASVAGSSLTNAPLHLGAVSLEDVDTIALGSTGMWNEISPRKALLRLSTLPEASGRSSSAAKLVNLALQAVTRRMSRLSDPRMQSLSSVTALQSLWVGSRANYSGHPRAAVRRKRGDVHGDLAAVVIQLSRPGAVSHPEHSTWSTTSDSQPTLAPSQITPAGRWAFVRAALVDFPRAGKQQTLQRWQDTVHAASVAHLKSLESKAQRQSLAATLDATASAWRQPARPIPETVPIAATISAY